MQVGDGSDPPALQLSNDFIESLKSFVYLGSIVTTNGPLKPKITLRRALEASALHSLRKTHWWFQNIPHKTKLQNYHSAILSILLYGSETWPSNKSLATIRDGFNSQALKTVENIKWLQSS